MSEILSLQLLRSMALPQPGTDSDKEQRGRVLVVAGSHAVPGAGLLAGVAALRAGAGKLQLAVPGSLATALGVAFPEAGIVALHEASGHPSPGLVQQLLQPVAHADAVLLGPGWMDQDISARIVQGVLSQRENNFVLDAGGLGGLLAAGEIVRRQNGNVVITPHAGEMANLLKVSRAEIEAEPQAFALQVAKRLNCVVALKGAVTHIADPSGTVYANTTGSVGLGTSGSGDVLAGMIAGFLARGASALSAAAWGVYVHAKAGERLEKQVARLGFLAREIADAIPGVISGLEMGEA